MNIAGKDYHFYRVEPSISEKELLIHELQSPGGMFALFAGPDNAWMIDDEDAPQPYLMVESVTATCWRTALENVGYRLIRCPKIPHHIPASIRAGTALTVKDL